MVENVDTNSDKNEAKPDEVDISDESKTDEFTNGMNQVLSSELRTIVVLVYRKAFKMDVLGWQNVWKAYVN